MGSTNKTLSQITLNKITEIVCADIGSKILDGATYVILSNNKSNRTKIERYLQVRRDIDQEGFGANEVLRVYELPNGYIFDVDMSIAKTITASLAEMLSKTNDDVKLIRKLVDIKPYERYNRDCESLANLCLKNFKKGIRKFDIALYSRINHNVIKVTATDNEGRSGVISFPAFAVRMTDLTEINSKYLVEKGIRIASVEACEIVGSNSGLRVIIMLGERVRKNG